MKLTKHPTKSMETLARKKAALIPCVYHFYKSPPVFVRGERQYLIDADGRRYLDMFSGVSVNHLGHAHPRIVDAVCNQIGKLAHTTTIYLTEPMLDLAEKLISITPSKFTKTFFCSSGSEANEMAFFLAQSATGKPGVLSLENSLHGNTKLTMSMTGIPFWKTDIAPVPEIYHSPAPICNQCPFGKASDSCSVECAGAIDSLLEAHKDQIGAIILEPIQGNGGIIVPQQKFYDELNMILKKHEILLIVDEVQTGFGRTGKMFAFEHFNLEPDIITMAKALGGGLPAGAVITTDSIAERFTRPRASTFGGNLVTARAGCAVVDTIINYELPKNAEETGKYFLDQLYMLKTKYSIIADVRGKGLMIGVEMKESSGMAPPEVTDFLLESLLQDEILAGKAGQNRNVLVFEPPLIISQEDVDLTIKALNQALALL